MELYVYRRWLHPRWTIGELFVDQFFECYTLEDAVRDGPKVPGETAIPPGRYVLDITRSARFGQDLPILRDVPGFSGIRIHAGNTDEDTSGCILVGRVRREDSIGESRVALAALAAKIVLPAWITVSPDPPAASPSGEAIG